MSATAKQDMVSNPFSTGGGGSVFEQMVQASLLSCLLVRSHIPGLTDATIHELHLQAEHLGYATDDAVVLAVAPSGQSHKQLWSVKHDAKFTLKDNVFQDVLRDAWADFKNTPVFNPSLDSIVLATGPLPTSYKHFFSLLEIIRATSTHKDFSQKCNRKGFLSQEAHQYFSLVRQSIEASTQVNPSSEEVWSFLKSFHVLGFDFDQAASKDEALIKSMLALSIRAGTGGSGDSLWNSIYKWISARNPRAGSFTHDTLPEEWRKVATTITAHFESGAIERLSEHSKLTLRRIRSKVGSEHELHRTEVVGALAASFIQHPVTLVSGEAGVGKSAAAWMALQQVANDAPVFALQAKEFARAHIDHALADLRVHESLSRISSLFGLARRKFILLESVERLLESAETDAFADLLKLLTDDPTWRVVLTCRHHAENLIKDSFLTPAGINSHHVFVPKLSLEELNYILSKKPDLRSIVDNDRTRSFLRNPWFLDKACLLTWGGESAKRPLDAIHLRNTLWKQIVVREDAKQGGIHRKRDRVFQELALRRAKSLKSFVKPPIGEEEAVQALVADELLVEDANTSFVAPAHDVLEDWALVRWIEYVFTQFASNPLDLFNELEHHLPIRRAYRQWLNETLDGPNTADIRQFTESVFSRSDIPHYWRDETVVSLLLSSNSPQFIASHGDHWLAAGKQQLKVVIHLMRLACKVPNPHFQLSEQVLANNFGDAHLVPEGAAWGAIIRLIHRNLSQFSSDDFPYLLTLLEDWKSGIHWQQPAPDGTHEAALIALHFWNSLEDIYQREDDLKRLLEVMLTMTRAFSEAFTSMVRQATATRGKKQGRSYKKKLVEEKLLSFGDGAPACRSHPALVVETARKVWGIDSSLRNRPGDHYGTSIEAAFGLPSGLSDYLPSSAWQGPFRQLLMHHFDVGLRLITDLANYSTLRYVESEMDTRWGMPPVEVTFSLDDDTTCTQWANERLWLIHRGTMPGPRVLESALMALEEHLLQLASEKQDLRELSRTLITESNSVLITAIIASVAMAYPQSVGDVALVFFANDLFLELDRSRLQQDSTFVDIGEEYYDHIQKIHHRERLDSSKLPHRKHNLDQLALQLQTGALKERMWELIDNWNSELTSYEDQSSKIKLLRLKFHNIDIRNFTTRRKLEDGKEVLTPSPPEPDIEQVVSEGTASMASQIEAVGLIVWGRAIFEKRESNSVDPSEWRIMLERAQKAQLTGGSDDELEPSLYDGGPGYVAAVCVRDHWIELDDSDRNWCTDCILDLVLRNKDTNNPFARVSSSILSSQGPAARVLPLLFDQTDEATATRIREAIAVGLTHANEGVRDYTALGVGSYLWSRNPELANSCIDALLEFAKSDPDEQSVEPSGDAVSTRKTLQVRALISEVRTVTHLQFDSLDPANRTNIRTLLSIANIVSDQVSSPVSQDFFLKTAQYLVMALSRSQNQFDLYAGSRDYHGEHALRREFTHFVARCNLSDAARLWAPFKEVIHSHASEVADVFHSLVYAEDRLNLGVGFWAIWKETRTALFQVRDWEDKLAYANSDFQKLFSALLLDGVQWKASIREWPPLRGHYDEMKDLILAVAHTPQAFKSSIRLLVGVGAILLPQALIWIDFVMQKGAVHLLVGGRTELFNLSRILSQFVFGRTSLLRHDEALRNAALRILDAMINQGSSAAYRMRDALISPVGVSSNPE